MKQSNYSEHVETKEKIPNILNINICVCVYAHMHVKCLSLFFGKQQMMNYWSTIMANRQLKF